MLGRGALNSVYKSLGKFSKMMQGGTTPAKEEKKENENMIKKGNTKAYLIRNGGNVKYIKGTMK